MIQFATITSEGGLLPPDLLVRIASLDKTVRGLAPADYHLDEGQQHGEAISRSWSRLLPAWRSFRTELAKLPEDDPGTSVTRDRFLQPLLQELGYGRVPTAKAIDIEGKSYAITHAWGDTPIHLLGARVSLEVRTVGQAGAAKSSPHGLVQDLLNRSKPHLWALLSNGFVLRLLRDHHSLTSQAYVEVDLEAMFDGERYADFVLLWLVFHQSRSNRATARSINAGSSSGSTCHATKDSQRSTICATASSLRSRRSARASSVIQKTSGCTATSPITPSTSKTTTVSYSAWPTG